VILKRELKDDDHGNYHGLTHVPCGPALCSGKESRLSRAIRAETRGHAWPRSVNLILILWFSLSTYSSHCADLPCSCQTAAQLHLNGLAGNILSFAVSNALPGNKYDLYFRNSLVGDNWRWRRVCNGIQADPDGKASFQLREPDPMEGIFVLLDAGDDDADGLSNGYECFFTYNGNHTACDNSDSDNDGLGDGWEVEYGLDPTRPLGA